MKAPRTRHVARGTRHLCAIILTLAATRAQASPPQRIVSLIPSVTEMLFAIGEGKRVVGVSNYDEYPPEVKHLPRAGGLLDPNVERLLSLKPDLVIVYQTQNELKQRLDRASIPYYSYEHRALADITVTLRAIGKRIESPARAEALAADMERSIAAIRASVAGVPHPRTLMVFEREPASLRNITASGGYGFLHDMLEAAGGVNVFADIKQQAVTASTEMILGRRPDVIVELKYGTSTTTDLARDLQAWNALASVPAVRNKRIHALKGDQFVVPGPRVVAATKEIARTLHPGAPIK